MIDCVAFRESNPSHDHPFHGVTLSDLLSPERRQQRHPSYGIRPFSAATSESISGIVQHKNIKTVPEDEMVLCAPTVFGYAFAEKAWAQIRPSEAGGEETDPGTTSRYGRNEDISGGCG